MTIENYYVLRGTNIILKNNVVMITIMEIPVLKSNRSKCGKLAVNRVVLSQVL